MRKVLILVLVAAVIGVVASQLRPAAPARGAARAPEAQPQILAQSTAPAPAEPPAAVAARVEQTPTARPATVQARPEPVLLETRAPAATAVQQPAAPVAPDRAREVVAVVDQASALLKTGDRTAARRVLTGLYLDSQGELAQRVRALLDKINADLVWNARCIEGAQVHVVQPGETLSTIGPKYGVNWRMIQRINNMQPNEILRSGRRLKIIAGQMRVVVWRGEYRLALLVDDAFIKQYPIGVGKDDRTPIGTFVVENMLVNPRWYPPWGGVIEHGQPGHLLGDRWIGFRDEPGASGFGIHGTNEPETIGTKCSNGCVRMLNDDVIEIYDFLKPGAQVEIRK